MGRAENGAGIRARGSRLMTTEEILSTVRSAEFRRFMSAARVLWNASYSDLERASVEMTDKNVARFISGDRLGGFITADDETKAAVWRYIADKLPNDL